MLAPGDRVEGYRVREKIGEGGVAGVYEIVHDRLGSVHALKVLEIGSPIAGRRLLREGRLQASVRHPNLVAVTDFVRVGEHPALVLEHVDGPTLEEWMPARRRTVPGTLALFRGILAGVEALHAAGLMHLDLKPANILVACVGDRLVPKVADLGLARVVDDTEDLALKAGPWAGTPPYMAPEQFRGGIVDERADLFALGCILYELATGRRAFDGPDVLSVAEAASSGRYVPPEQLVPDLPPEVCAAIRGLLVPEPAQRLASCAHVRAALDGRWSPPDPAELTLAGELRTVRPALEASSPKLGCGAFVLGFGLWAFAVIAIGLFDLWLLWTI